MLISVLILIIGRCPNCILILDIAESNLITFGGQYKLTNGTYWVDTGDMEMGTDTAMLQKLLIKARFNWSAKNNHALSIFERSLRYVKGGTVTT